MRTDAHNPGQVLNLVLDAERELNRSEYVSSVGPYTDLCALANQTDLAGRTLIAKMAVLADAREVRLSRAFDNCFENYDGGEVRAALEADPALTGKLAGIFG